MFERIDFDNPDERDNAAAEYVLGTLTREQKAQFETVLAFSPELQADVARWEEQLQVLQSQLQPVEPPARVWRAINKATRTQSAFGWHSLGLWRGLTAMAFSVALVLGVMYVNQPAEMNMQSDSIYVVNNKQEQPAWIVNASMDRSAVVVQAVQPGSLPHGKVCELWLVREGRPPISLGVLPHEGLKKVNIEEPLRSQLMNAELLVSIEDKGASSGQPAGPVISRGPWVPMQGATRRL